MILYLGVGDAPGDYQPITIPDEYAPADIGPLLPFLWWGSEPPTWVASDNPELAQVASDVFGGAEVRETP